MQLQSVVSSYRQQQHRDQRDLRRVVRGAGAEDGGEPAVLLLDGWTRPGYLRVLLKKGTKYAPSSGFGAERERLPDQEVTLSAMRWNARSGKTGRRRELARHAAAGLEDDDLIRGVQSITARDT